jgi:hypothetical protein
MFCPCADDMGDVVQCSQHPIHEVPSDTIPMGYSDTGMIRLPDRKKRREMDQSGTDRHSIYAARLRIKILTVPCVQTSMRTIGYQ